MGSQWAIEHAAISDLVRSVEMISSSVMDPHGADTVLTRNTLVAMTLGIVCFMGPTRSALFTVRSLFGLQREPDSWENWLRDIW